ncbi:MAG: DUF1700 domain-containing protein [Actinomycetia bacterium]|nr:DUF1700 domain-containing protein [Actinomycetes bacterium]
MNKTQFLSELRGKLVNLPESEVNSAVGYYEEYLLDAGPENEEQIIEELGSPNAVASKIIGEFALSDAPVGAATSGKTIESSAKTLWVVILAVLASPIALPLAIAVVVIVFALLISVLAVLFAFAVTGVALVVAGIAALFVAVWALFFEFGTALWMAGSGLVAIGVGILIAQATVLLTQSFFTGMQKMLGALLIRKAA